MSRFSDTPITQPTDDCLGRGPSVAALATLLSDPELGTPLVVGVQGDWGSGKTSVLNCLKAEVAPAGAVVWFDAWRHGGDRGALWRGLVGVLVTAARGLLPKDDAGHKELDTIIERLYRDLTRSEKGGIEVDARQFVPWLARKGFGLIGLGGEADDLVAVVDDAEEMAKFIGRKKTEHHLAQLASVEQFHTVLHRLIAVILDHAPNRRLFLFVDDLDRCLPEVALELLEAIKLFLDAPGCVFVLGMDRRVVCEAVRVRYRDLARDGGALPFEPAEYIDKIVQIPFTLPPLSRPRIKDYVARWCQDHHRPDIAEACADLIAVATLPNPRGVKRTLNLLHLNSRLRGGTVDAAVLRQLAFVIILLLRFPAIHTAAAAEPALLKDLALGARLPDNQGPRAPLFQGHPGLRDLFRDHDTGLGVLNTDQLESLLFAGRA